MLRIHFQHLPVGLEFRESPGHIAEQREDANVGETGRFLQRFKALPAWLAWESFGEMNGDASFAEMVDQIAWLRADNGSPDGNFKIGIPQGKTYIGHVLRCPKYGYTVTYVPGLLCYRCVRTVPDGDLTQRCSRRAGLSCGLRVHLARQAGRG